MPEKSPRIGELRWPFTLVKRNQTAAVGTGITETLATTATIWGKIENTYATTYWGINGAQSDRPITHMIWVRWRPYLDNTYALQRARINPATLDVSNGDPITVAPGVDLTFSLTYLETYRIRRVCEIDQKTWIVRLECEQETVE